LTLTLLQLHATIVFVGLKAVQNPATRIPNWNSSTIYGLSRFLYFVLGATWLFVVTYWHGILPDVVQEQRVWQYARRLIIWLVLLYGLCYLALLILA
jgi:hypothetical protein